MLAIHQTSTLAKTVSVATTTMPSCMHSPVPVLYPHYWLWVLLSTVAKKCKMPTSPEKSLSTIKVKAEVERQKKFSPQLTNALCKQLSQPMQFHSCAVHFPLCFLNANNSQCISSLICWQPPMCIGILYVDNLWCALVVLFVDNFQCVSPILLLTKHHCSSNNFTL